MTRLGSAVGPRQDQLRSQLDITIRFSSLAHKAEARLANLKQKISFACAALSGALKLVAASLEYQLPTIFGWELPCSADQISIELQRPGHALRKPV